MTERGGLPATTTAPARERPAGTEPAADEPASERTLAAVGLSFHTAPVDLRERLALPRHRAEAALSELRAHDAVDEAVAIFTCNRTELYLAGPDGPAAAEAALRLLSDRSGVPAGQLDGAVYTLHGVDAARHLFRVASGLDSLVVGEAEIQGQVRRSFEEARQAGASGRFTYQLFNAAIRTGKRVRTETALGAGHVSVPSVAMTLARSRLGELAGRTVAVLGAGETSELTTRALAEQGVRAVIVASRGRERADALARRFGGRAVGLEELPQTLARVDIVVSATAAPRPIIAPDDVVRAMERRAGRPLLLIDLAVPRDVHHDCGRIPGVALYDVDDLQAIVAENRSLREADTDSALAIVDEEVDRFARWLGSQSVAATVSALRRHGDRVATEVLAANAGRWEALTERDHRRVEAMARSIVKRLLHGPTRRLVDGGAEDHARHAAALRSLFGLDGGAESESSIHMMSDPSGNPQPMSLPPQPEPDPPPDGGAPALEWPLPGGRLERWGRTPEAIEKRSRALAAEAVRRWPGPDGDLAASCVYAAGDLTLGDQLSIHGDPAERGAAALRAGGGVLVDTSMARSGATRIAADVAVAVQVEGAADLARRAGTTRAAAGVRLAWDEHGRDGIVVVGNAPTALLAALDLAEARGAPACIIATCPGFTLAKESKDMLAESGLPHFAVLGTRGGTGMAVAVLNAIGRLAAAGA
ncbi:MAG TPA: glutamyl-tRNA reductase [Solirubrobacteraceae bacterium]|nr:glutamyl-tRNA reductase [Solirubrobacteraceae bacterium]